MKEWPAELNICGLTYSVEYVALDQEVDGELFDKAQGQITYCPRAIRIMAGAKPRKRQVDDILDTLIHEIVHGILEATPVLDGVLMPEQEKVKEHAVTEFCRLFTDVLVRNGLIVLPKNRPELTKRTEA